ncbi:TetR/AcrR family transcriptional regulator [Arthrobacter sp. 35W]|uniref:TetR/AcrR family transcriptional regulator n=1 Tax=Arthrobacter sp. 35W TaxID=1132441 RepID=UPI00041BFEC1|nr:TetR family transcriptional regulator [Arthrobacter sp. 35W]
MTHSVGKGTDKRALLIAAAGELVAASGRDVKMADAALHAGMSVATAYRHFRSLDAVLAAYRLDVGRRLRHFSVHAPGTGVVLLDAVCRQWIDLVLLHGPAMIQSRSRHGYLARLKDETPHLMDQALALKRPLAQACLDLGLSVAGDEAMFLWNHLFDPREIMDLAQTAGLDRHQIGNRLVGALQGALRGWSQGTP